MDGMYTRFHGASSDELDVDQLKLNAKNKKTTK